MQTWFTKQLRGMHLLARDDDDEQRTHICSTRFTFTVTAPTDIIIKTTGATARLLRSAHAV